MTYETKSGDMWDSIAFEQMGSEKYTDLLVNANRDKVEHFIFSAGVKLEVPEVPAEVEKEYLPPWR